jgi:hypothetical protein
MTSKENEIVEEEIEALSKSLKLVVMMSRHIVSPMPADKREKIIEVNLQRYERAVADPYRVHALFEVSDVIGSLSVLWKTESFLQFFDTNKFDSAESVMSEGSDLIATALGLSIQLEKDFPSNSLHNDLSAIDVYENITALVFEWTRSEEEFQSVIRALKSAASLSQGERQVLRARSVKAMRGWLWLVNDARFAIAWMHIWTKMRNPSALNEVPPLVTLAFAESIVEIASHTTRETEQTLQAVAADEVSRPTIKKNQDTIDRMRFALNKSKEVKLMRFKTSLAQIAQHDALLVHNEVAMAVAHASRDTQISPARLFEKARTEALTACATTQRLFGVVPMPAKIRFLNGMIKQSDPSVEYADEFIIAAWWCEQANRLQIE